MKTDTGRRVVAPLKATFADGIIQAKHLIRPLRGGSNNILTLGDDDNYYVVRFSEVAVDPTPLGEWLLSHRLALALGLSTPRLVLINVSPEVIRTAPVHWFGGHHCGLRPYSGQHFGTEFVGKPEGTLTSDYLPRRTLHRVLNRPEFLGMLILDIYTNRQIPRKAIFARNRAGEVTACFLGSSGTFGPLESTTNNGIFKGAYFENSVYSGLWNDTSIERWIKLLRETAPRVLERNLDLRLSEWCTVQSETLAQDLRRRLWSIETLVHRCTKRMRD